MENNEEDDLALALQMSLQLTAEQDEAEEAEVQLAISLSLATEEEEREAEDQLLYGPDTNEREEEEQLRLAMVLSLSMQASKSAECEAKPGAVEEEEDCSEQFECPVCLEEMRPPVRIHQCVDGHLLCGLCRENPAILICPICRGKIMGRAVGMEKLARALFGEQK
eukprot:GFUD01044112.1.p1 GENE.GFUD01044112.1~~GFUD01044112.1.p1  ORF type:complete len:166 (+),score=67.16 GFUD01044112.1:103-600(+)